MADTIDVRDLTKKQVKALKMLADLFREQAKITKGQEAAVEEEFTLGSKKSNVIGRLTRAELYEDR